MSSNLRDHEFDQALEAIATEDITTEEKVEMLMQIAMGLQNKPKSPIQLHNAVTLYDKALELCPPGEALHIARINARKATALQAIPDDGSDHLERARIALESAIPDLGKHGIPEEHAEAEMNLGLVIQSLCGFNQALIQDAINAYQRALKVFTRDAFPAEFAIIHNNLATAFLSMQTNSDTGKMREALAVQSFQEALSVVSMTDQPTEYAMLQNNLGNALQSVRSGHSVENNLRALDAYDEALRVRTLADTPLEYANTICNKANCICALPDDLEHPDKGNRQNLRDALALYQQAQTVFEQFGELGKAQMIKEMITGLEADVGTGHAGSREGKGFGASRI